MSRRIFLGFHNEGIDDASQICFLQDADGRFFQTLSQIASSAILFSVLRFLRNTMKAVRARREKGAQCLDEKLMFMEIRTHIMK